MRKVIKVSRKLQLAVCLISIFVLQTSVMAQDKVRQIDELMSLYHKYQQFKPCWLLTMAR